MAPNNVSLLVGLLVLALGCRSDIYTSRNFFASGGCESVSASYFPVAGANIFASLYIESLTAMDEAPLCKYSVGETYRFLWQRAFHNTLAFRITKTAQGADLIVKELQSLKLIKNIHIMISMRDWERFLGRLKAAQFGTSPGLDRRFKNVTVWDGAQWVLEGVAHGKYIIDDRWSPTQDGEHAHFSAACLYLLELSGLHIDSKEIY